MVKVSGPYLNASLFPNTHISGTYSKMYRRLVCNQIQSPNWYVSLPLVKRIIITAFHPLVLQSSPVKEHFRTVCVFIMSDTALLN